MEQAALSKEVHSKMEKTLAAMMHDFSGIRTGRASTSLLDPVLVESYGGDRVPITQVATVNAPEPRLITVQVWDKSLVKSVEKGIANSNLGLNPSAEGQLIRVPIPQLTGERREELIKVTAKYAEKAKVAIRTIRRDYMEIVKQKEKAKSISEDESKKMGELIQKVTDEYISKIDEKLAQKEKDIKQV